MQKHVTNCYHAKKNLINSDCPRFFNTVLERRFGSERKGRKETFKDQVSSKESRKVVGIKIYIQNSIPRSKKKPTTTVYNNKGFGEQ